MELGVRWLLLAYALSNVVLYSMLLPLWEGFDEPFHFGYVQTVANGEGFPDPRTSRLSQETGSSLLLAPASVSVQRNLPELVTYREFFEWPAARREYVRQELERIPAKLRRDPSQFLNYEAQQAPLAYFVLAIPERLMAAWPLPTRVMALRMIAGTLGVLLLMAGARRVCEQLGMSEAWVNVTLYCVLSIQMTWATLARVSNDWLAVPLTVWVLSLAIEYGKRPVWRGAAVLSIGLLTKAYFLAFAPLLAAICMLRRRWQDFTVAALIVLGMAGPWYARNQIRYGSLSGMQESIHGGDALVGLRALQIRRLPAWLVASTTSALWTANNTFRTFSVKTLGGLMLAWIGALVLWTAGGHKRVEWIVISHCVLFLFALAYYGALSRAMPEPWYSQVLVFPLLALAMLGTSRTGRLGKAIASAMVLICGYVIVCTYWVKLIPLYSGFEGRTSLAGVASLYAHGFPGVMSGMRDVCLGPAWMILVMSGVVSVLAVGLPVVLMRGFMGGRWRIGCRSPRL